MTFFGANYTSQEEVIKVDTFWIGCFYCVFITWSHTGREIERACRKPVIFAAQHVRAMFVWMLQDWANILQHFSAQGCLCEFVFPAAKSHHHAHSLENCSSTQTFLTWITCYNSIICFRLNHHCSSLAVCLGLPMMAWKAKVLFFSYHLEWVNFQSNNVHSKLETTPMTS